MATARPLRSEPFPTTRAQSAATCNHPAPFRKHRPSGTYINGRSLDLAWVLARTPSQGNHCYTHGLALGDGSRQILERGARRYTMDPNTVTRLLQRVRAGEESAETSLLDLVYDELRGVASAIFAGERAGHTLQPTAVVHEAWLKLESHLDRVTDRVHFFAISSRAMRRILIDHSRRARARGSKLERVTLSGKLGEAADGIDLVDLSDLLDRLSNLNARHAQVVELRFLGGLTIPETAEVLGVSHGTVETDWVMARSWLRTQLDNRS